MDVAVCNGGDSTVYVYLGRGDGTFQVPEILYTQGLAPTWITAVNLRNNGHLDLAVTDGDSSSLEIFLGKGDGTFLPGTQVSLQQIPTFVAAGDFNKDGNQDLVVGLTVAPGAVQPQFLVLLGNGQGGFSGTLTPPPIQGSSFGPIPTGWVASGDLNKDGFPDVVTTVTGGSAITYMNQGGQAFSKGAPFGPQDGAMVVELGDMNEDGCLDAVELGTFGYLTMAKGTCDGNFVQGNFVAQVGDLDPAVKIVDVNGDGHLDVVSSAAYYAVGGPGYGAEGGYLVSVLKGDGTGNFSPAQVYRGGADAYSLVVADFNGDHMPEIITADSFENQGSYFLNDGNGNYDGSQGETIGYLTGVTNSPIPGSPVLSVDLNGDAKPDIVLTQFGTVSSVPSQITVMLNDGTGKFLPPVRSPISVGPTLPYPVFITGAFRNPAKPDLIYLTTYVNPGIVAWFPGNGDGTFGAPVTLATLPSPAQLVAGDFNNDGKLDFLVYGGDGSSNDVVELDVFLGRGDGTFSHLPAQILPGTGSAGIQQIFAIDLNHDGKLDLMTGHNTNGGWTNSGDDLVEFIGNGDGTFKAPSILIPHFGAVAVADLNGDGLPDLVQARDPAENVGAQLFGTPGVTVYLGKPDGTFARQPTYTLSGFAIPSESPAFVGDFNGDGIPDIAVRYFKDVFVPDEARLHILEGVGDGTFVVTNHYHQLPAYSYPFLGADFNGDGTVDLVELVGYTASFHTIPAAPGPSLDIQFDSRPIVATSGTATVVLNKPASSTETVTLQASDPAVQLPAALSFSSGQQSQSFGFSLGSAFDGTHVLALSATLGTETAIAYAAKPNPTVQVGVAEELLLGAYPLAHNSYSVEPGESFSLTLRLLSEGGYSGTFTSFNCSGLPQGAACSFEENSLPMFMGGIAQVNFAVSTSSSTPFGTYPVQITSTDGQIVASTSLQLGIGDFTLSVNPSTSVIGPAGQAEPVVTSSATNGLFELLFITCSGLPVNARCGQNSVFYTGGGSTSIGVGGGPFAAGDYPFQIIGTAGIVSHQINSVLRVGDFSSSLDKTSAAISPGQTATFVVTLKSINHYSSNISVYCSPSSSVVTCTAAPSPATLADGATTTVQLTVTAPVTANFVPAVPLSRRPGRGVPYVIACCLLIFTFALQKKKRVLAGCAVFVVSAWLASCGAGSTPAPTPIPTPTPTPPPPPQSQTVTLTVVASAASTYSDSNNQKTLSPIVITVQ
jgi:hypothetical protein